MSLHTWNNQRFSSIKSSRIKWLIYLHCFQSFGHFKFLKFYRPQSRVNSPQARVQRPTLASHLVQNPGIPVCPVIVTIQLQKIFDSRYLAGLSFLIQVNIMIQGMLHCVKCVQIRSLFWSVFSRIRTEYGEIFRISPYSVRMWENTDQEKLRIWTLFTQCSFQGLSMMILVGSRWLDIEMIWFYLLFGISICFCNFDKDFVLTF